MTPELVVFDCDGVLVDTEGPVAAVISRSLTTYGLPMSAHQVADMFTGGTMDGVEAEARRRGAALPHDWLVEVYGQIYARIAEGVAVFDGVFDLLDHLDAAGVPTFVASNGTLQKMQLSLGPSGLWDRFGGRDQGRIMSRETFAAKPDPAMIRHAMAKTGATASRTVMIDDSTAGCSAGIAAGVRTIGFATEGQDDTLAALGAEVATTMADVKRLIWGQ